MRNLWNRIRLNDKVFWSAWLVFTTLYYTDIINGGQYIAAMLLAMVVAFVLYVKGH